jgi:methyl-accepting chemotaxis protein
MAEGRKGKDSRFRKKRSRILYEITGLIVVILIISGLVTFFLVVDSQNKLIDKSIDKVIETEASNMTSTLNYMTAAELAKDTNIITGVNTQQIISDMAQKKMTDVQRAANQVAKAMVDTGIFDLENISIIIPPSAFSKEAFVIVSSDESLVYEWKVPDYIVEAMKAENPYLLCKEGVPELGLEGAQLIILGAQEFAFAPGFQFFFVSLVSMQEKIDSINAYYDQERRNVSLTLGLSVFLSIITVIIIIFFLLSYLIRKRITDPIDELATKAEEIMEGNLDVDIEVHEGGEFQGLEQAFREMAQSIRKLIFRSTEEE